MTVKVDWIERIAAELHKVWMELKVDREGMEKAKSHPHFHEWDEMCSKVENPSEAMNQDRFLAAMILRAYAKGDATEPEKLREVIHNSWLTWAKLVGDSPQKYHVPYIEADERSIEERTKQADRIFKILEQIKNVNDIRKFEWIP